MAKQLDALEKREKPTGKKWKDVLTPVPEHDGGDYDPWATEPGWGPEAELDGEKLPLRGLKEQLFSWDRARVSTTINGVWMRPWKDDYSDESFTKPHPQPKAKGKPS